MTAALAIDLSALAAHRGKLANMAPGSVCAAVVKADAYGLGLEPAAKTLAKAGARRFYVAWPSEGAALRAALGDGVEIAVFHGPTPDTLAIFTAARLEPVINSIEQLKLWLSQPAPA